MRKTSSDTNSNDLRILDNIGIVLFMLFAFSLPFEMQYSYLVLLALGLLVLINFFKTPKRKVPPQFWLFQIVYLLALSGYLYSSDIYRANYMLERQLTILLFPILIPFVYNFSKPTLDKVLLGLLLGSIVSIIYLYYCAFQSLNHHHLPLKALLSDPYLNHNFSLPLDIHAGYLSMFIALSIFYLLNSFRKCNKPFPPFLIFIALAILILGLLSLASRNAIISTAIVAIFMYPFFFVKKRYLYFITIFSICALLFVSMKKSDYFKSRFSSEFVKEISIKKVKLKDQYQVEPRMQRWICAVDLIKKRPLLGYGTGDEVGLLKQKYHDNNLMVSYHLEFNAHNQYLSTLIKHGFIGLLLFMSAFLYYLYLGISSKNFVYTAFIFLLLIGFFTENILDMNKGIFFFAFFNTLFGYNILFERKHHKGNLKTALE